MHGVVPGIYGIVPLYYASFSYLSALNRSDSGRFETEIPLLTLLFRAPIDINFDYQSFKRAVFLKAQHPESSRKNDEWMSSVVIRLPILARWFLV